jgi:hypothetical protein
MCICLNVGEDTFDRDGVRQVNYRCYICFKCVFTPPQLEVLIRLLSLSLVLPLRVGYIRLVYSVR